MRCFSSNEIQQHKRPRTYNDIYSSKENGKSGEGRLSDDRRIKDDEYKLKKTKCDNTCMTKNCEDRILPTYVARNHAECPITHHQVVHSFLM